MDDENARLAGLLAQLRGRGERITAARRVVLDEIVRAGELHLTTEELAERVHSRDPSIHRSTVYRTLDFLETCGLIDHIHLAHRPPTHHLRDDRHLHAVCERCERTMDLPADLLDELAGTLARDHAFTMRVGHFAFSGRCQDCLSV